MVNKYQRWYNSLIFKAKNRNTDYGYYESHHIIPKCIGGSNNLDNLVKLTFREHFIAHALLCKIYRDTAHYCKLRYAFLCMHKQKNKFQQRQSTGSRLYSILREQHYAELRGTKRSPDVIEKIKLNRIYHPHTAETKAKISNALKGMKRLDTSAYIRLNRSKAEKQKLSPDQCIHIRELRSNGLTWRAIGEQYHKSPNVIRNVVLRINGYQNR